MEESTALELRDNARQQLLAIRDVETGVEYLNKVKAIEVWAKAEKKDAELQNLIAEQKIRTQRILGRLIMEGQENNEIARPETFMGNRFVDSPTREQSTPIKTLSDIGLTRKESSTFKAIASIPEEVFEETIIEKKAAVDNAVSELTTAGMLRVAQDIKKNVHVSNNSGENEWYTPGYIIDSAYAVMGWIDLDPASSDFANKTVKAVRYYTKEDNGLDKEWSGNIWLNPPYSQPLMTYFANAVVDKRCEYDQCIVIVNNATETMWFQSMLNNCDAVCFLKSRVKFIDKNGNPTGTPLQGQAIMYFGNDYNRFKNEFKSLGICLRKMM